ncbi:MAG: hypothetical protein N4A72_06545 [Bacteroidales bacterium]|nr:hypothetical protein [Bacteroidales bacterium]
MNKIYFIVIMLMLLIGCNRIKNSSDTYIVKHDNMAYDFTFAELAVDYLESGDSTILYKIAESKAAKHILNHAVRFGYNVPKSSELALVKHLLTPIDKTKKKLKQLKANIQYARENIAKNNIAGTESAKYLPDISDKERTIYFTFGYDIGVAYENNCSLNLIHSCFKDKKAEMIYYTIHESHHAGFIAVKNNRMVSLNIETHREMLHLIEYLTHLEGMAVYTAYEARERGEALNDDNDYITLQTVDKLEEYTREYFEIYNYFKSNPDADITEEDWSKISVLSDDKRLWYIVGAKMAKDIDKAFGRDSLVALINRDPHEFFVTYNKL